MNCGVPQGSILEPHCYAVDTQHVYVKPVKCGVQIKMCLFVIFLERLGMCTVSVKQFK